MSTELSWIRDKARKEPKLVFTSLYHHITDVDNLRSCYEALEARKATGVDGETKQEYGVNLDERLEDLSARLKRMGYVPQPKRRSYIPKPGSEKGRPLGISCFEDKIVEMSTKRTLEAIFESEFEESSYGYRPGRNQHDCLDAVGKTIQRGKVSYVVEADIKGFFDTVNHAWMEKFLSHRIGDHRVIRLIWRMLKAGIMEDGLTKASEEGTPQGSILSPLLSNIYLHYALDMWFRLRVAKGCIGEAYYFRYADDFIACFQRRGDAEGFLKRLAERLEGFNLTLAEEKTRCIEFGRFARANARKREEKPAEFTFLGFTHYCGKTRNGYFKIKRRTSRKKLRQGLQEFTQWARKARNCLRKGEMIKIAAAKVRGHLAYYAVTDNYKSCDEYAYWAKRILRKWLNRKSQRPAYTWEAFIQAIESLNWPKVFIRKDLNPCSEQSGGTPNG